MAERHHQRPLRHLAIIPDGNRRWARQRGLAPHEGHRQGFLVTTPRLLDAFWRDHDVDQLTLWLFSTDNWQRDRQEIHELMQIYVRLAEQLRELASTHAVRVRHLGRTDRLPPSLSEALTRLKADTSSNASRFLHLAIDHGGTDALLDAVRTLVECADGDDLAGVLRAHLAATPDVIVRTSGVARLSGFMPLNSCFSELAFVDELYPDLSPARLGNVIDDYWNREQRFGR